MGVTFSILQHELAGMGEISIGRATDQRFESARLYLGESSVSGKDVLHVCSTHDECASIEDRGLAAVFVDSHASKPDPTASLSVTGGEGTLQVLNAILDICYRYEAWERDMDSALACGGDLQDLLDVSERMLKNNVVVVDPALKLLAYTKGTPCDDPITVELIEHGYHTEENIRKFQLHKRFKPWAKEEGFVVNDSYSICKYITVVKSFKTKVSFGLIVVMMCNEITPCDYLYDVFSMFLWRVERVAKREYPDDKPAGNTTDTFLHDLFLGGMGGDSVIRERSKLVGIPFEARFCLFAVPISNDSPVSRILADLATLVAPAKVVMLGGCIVVLCFNCVDSHCALHCEAGTCPKGHKSISSRINEFMEKCDLVCGRSSKFTSLSQANVAYRQARVSARLGEVMASKAKMLPIPCNWTRIFSFDRNQVAFIAEKAGVDLPLLTSTYAGTVIRSIVADDAAHGTDNYEFLYEYLLNERRANVVAEKLHMHRNNVKYRIDRIESKYGIDTNDPDLRFDFLLAFRLSDAESMQDAQ